MQGGTSLFIPLFFEGAVDNFPPVDNSGACAAVMCMFLRVHCRGGLATVIAARGKPAPVGCGGNCLGQMRHSCDKSSVARVEPRFHWVKVELETLTGVLVARVAESRATNHNLVRQIFGSGILSGDIVLIT